MFKLKRNLLPIAAILICIAAITILALRGYGSSIVRNANIAGDDYANIVLKDLEYDGVFSHGKDSIQQVVFADAIYTAYRIYEVDTKKYWIEDWRYVVTGWNNIF